MLYHREREEKKEATILQSIDCLPKSTKMEVSKAPFAIQIEIEKNHTTLYDMIDWHVTGPLIVTGVFSFAMLGVSTWNAVLLVRDSEKEIKVRFLFQFLRLSTIFERFESRVNCTYLYMNQRC